jgi:branched-subunit amino acid transport protein
MTPLIVLVVGGVVTLVFKSSFTLLGDSVRLPATIEAASSYVAPAMMAALAARSLAANVDGLAGPLSLPAGFVAVAVAALTRSLVWTVVAGTGAFIAADAIVAAAA